MPLLLRSDLLNVVAATSGAARETEGDVIQGTSSEARASVSSCMGDTLVVIEVVGAWLVSSPLLSVFPWGLCKLDAL